MVSSARTGRCNVHHKETFVAVPGIGAPARAGGHLGGFRTVRDRAEERTNGERFNSPAAAGGLTARQRAKIAETCGISSSFRRMAGLVSSRPHSVRGLRVGQAASAAIPGRRGIPVVSASSQNCRRPRRGAVLVGDIFHK